jgi:hypothetical protein
LLVDVGGLCVAARATPYVRAALASWDADGAASVIGHARTLDAAGAAFVNGTAAHGEDFDDTFEGGPVHSGAVVVPALLAAAERHRVAAADLLLGIAVGIEVLCRASLVAPKRIHKAGFHPTAVLGALGAAAGVAVALRLKREEFVNALGIVGSMAGGIIEYLAEGAWTKRLHPGWAAQSGIRAADLHAFISRAMPFQAPGSLKPDEYWSITAFLLRGHGLPDSALPITSDLLAQTIPLGAPAPAPTAAPAPNPGAQATALVAVALGAVTLLAGASALLLRRRHG